MDEREFRELTSDWFSQPTVNSCLTTCIKNALNDLAKRLKVNKLNMKLKRINDICGYDHDLGVQLQNTAPMLNSEFSKRGLPFRAYEKSGSSHRLEMIESIIKNNMASYPMIALHSDYHSENNIPVRNRDLDHVVLVLSMDEREVWFHDPYRPFAEKKGYVETFKNTLSNVKILDYWSRGYDPRWIMWIQREVKTSGLEEFGVEI